MATTASGWSEPPWDRLAEPKLPPLRYYVYNPEAMYPRLDDLYWNEKEESLFQVMDRAWFKCAPQRVPTRWERVKSRWSVTMKRLRHLFDDDYWDY